jgi:DNA-binding transcriptional ArsR family regulator
MQMNLDEEIAKIASLIGDKTRSAILIALMEGRALTAGELALRANISPQTASNHLKKLMDAKLIELIKTPTRYRYYKISSPLVAKAIESLSLLLPDKKRPPRHEKLDHEICFARTCYDHLAGTLGVKITNSLIKKDFIKMKDEEFILTEHGKVFFKEIDINYEKLISLKRQFAKPCLDWTEREYHLAGSLGKFFLEYLLNNRLLIRSKNKARVILLTEKGRMWINKHLAIE